MSAFKATTSAFLLGFSSFGSLLQWPLQGPENPYSDVFSCQNGLLREYSESERLLHGQFEARPPRVRLILSRECVAIKRINTLQIPRDIPKQFPLANTAKIQWEAFEKVALVRGEAVLELEDCPGWQGEVIQRFEKPRATALGLDVLCRQDGFRSRQ